MRKIFFVLTLHILLGAALGFSSEAPAKPNIIHIYADDLGYGDLGPYGQQFIRTPNIDTMAAEGMTFTNHYTSAPVCLPSRACLMTGLHQGNTPMRHNQDKDIPLPAEYVTIAEHMKAAGYATGAFGKWAIGDQGTTGAPLSQGFDTFFGFIEQSEADDYYADVLDLDDGYHNYPLPGNEDGGRATYTHDIIWQKAMDFVSENREGPFYVYLPVTIPHVWLIAPEDEILQYYRDNLPAQFDADDQAYAAMIERLDHTVGQLLDLLETLGIDENTIVMIGSDNGPASPGSSNRFESTAGLRGGKRSLWEGGIRSPFIVRWPGVVPAGSTCSEPTANYDHLATFAELADIPVAGPTDGRSNVALFTGGTLPERPLYWEFVSRRNDPDPTSYKQAARRGKWKAHRVKSADPGQFHEPTELFDLEADPGETQNIAADHPDIVAELEMFMDRNASESHTDPNRLIGIEDEVTVLAGVTSIIDVLANDKPETGSTTIDSFTQPQHGSVALDGGALAITPDPGYTDGADSFTYTPALNGSPAAEAVTVNVQVVNEFSLYDGDADGTPDGWELVHYGNLHEFGTADLDGDGVTDRIEFAVPARDPENVDRVDLDFQDDFERGPERLDFEPGLWSIQGALPGKIQPGLGTSGSRALEIDTPFTVGTSLTQFLEQTWRGASWTDFSAILDTYPEGESPAISADAAVVFHLVDAGDERADVRIRDGSEWQTFALDLDSAISHRYTVRQDYISGTWKFWVDGTPVSGTAFGFANPREAPGFFRIRQTASALSVLDDLTVTRAAPDGLTGVKDYSFWRQEVETNHGWAGSDDSATGDPNLNGLSNLEEYGFGFSNPVTGAHYYTPGLLVTKNGETDVMEFTFRRSRDVEDLFFEPEISGTLGSWAPLRPDVGQVTITPLAEIDLITITLPALEGAGFVRLRLGDGLVFPH